MPQPNSNDIISRYEFAQHLARQAGEVLKGFFLNGFSVSYKGATDPLTNADIASEQLISAAIQEAFPGDVLLAEEFHKDTALPRCYWCVDPLDGTVNFSHKLPWFNVSIAYIVDHKPVIGVVNAPMLEMQFSAIRGGGAECNGSPIAVSNTTKLIHALVATGFPYDRATTRKNFAEHNRLLLHVQDIRRMGSAAIDICHVANGVFDAYYEFGLGPWDFAAAWLIAEEAGAIASLPFGGAPNVLGHEILVANPDLHPQVLSILKETAE